ncbi:hypothetical protein PtB15_17B293 [Puccinia triticina]|nr:hypothetical protein PtB15_17B293 [Puccinia triticina]
MSSDKAPALEHVKINVGLDSSGSNQKRSPRNSQGTCPTGTHNSWLHLLTPPTIYLLLLLRSS